MHDWALKQGISFDWGVPPFQKFRLSLLHALAKFSQDPDLDLHAHLSHGVPTGVLDAIPPGHIWPRKPMATTSEPPPLHLWVRIKLDTGAQEDPDLTLALTEDEIQQGWVEEIFGGMDEAKQRWTVTAVGKLNVVHADGKKPR